MKSLTETLNMNLREGLAFNEIEDVLTRFAFRLETKRDIETFFRSLKDGITDIAATLEEIKDMAGDPESKKEKEEIFCEFEKKAKIHKLI